METENKKLTKKEYNDAYYKKLKDNGTAQEKIKCDICGKDYTYFSKSKHIKSQYHKMAESLKNKFIQSNES